MASSGAGQQVRKPCGVPVKETTEESLQHDSGPVGTFETSENDVFKLLHLAAVCIVVVCFNLDSIS